MHLKDGTAVQSRRAICPVCQRLMLSVLARSKEQMCSNQILVTQGNGSVNHMLTPQGFLPGSFLSDRSELRQKIETIDLVIVGTINTSLEGE